MTHARMTGEMYQVWITVQDADGQGHLESRWLSAATTAGLHAHHTHAA